MGADFSGYATKAGLKCTDGRTIMPDAFKHMDGARVPLVWQHGHSEPTNVLGHAILEARSDGVYAYGYFNDTPAGKSAKTLVHHRDITMLSIYANQLVEKSKQVLHGAIREVSLVLAGANPGALIDNVSIAHSDGEIETLDDEAVIYTGLMLENEDMAQADQRTVQDVFDTLNDEQKDLLYFMVGVATENGSVAQSALETDDQDDTLTHTEGNEMTHNVFEQGDSAPAQPALSHADVQGIIASATKSGSLKAAAEEYALAHGIENIDVLFPEARSLTTAPEWDKRRTEWVSSVLNGCRKSPFSRVKTWTADITYDEARAKGYIKGNLKKEEFFSVAKRVTTPQTIYKKQKLDRDDIIDITDFDVVSWMKGEMRLMLDEELARAILVGDGREVDDEDKINETNIRPIATDDPYYVVEVGVNTSDADSSVQEVLDSVILHRQFYKGTGTPTFYTTESFIARCLVLRDRDGRRIYRTVSDLAAEMRVDSLVAVEVLEDTPGLVGVIVNLSDYVVGSDRGGSVSMFDDFDIDYNQYKYLIETRVSGALTKPKSAMVVRETGTLGAPVTADAPTMDSETWTVTVPTVAGVKYVDQNNTVKTGDVVLTPGESLRLEAVALTGKFLTPGRTSWSFLRPSSAK